MVRSTGWRLAVAILFFPASGLAATISGVVLDPQDLAVEGARVELVCRDRVETVRTDNHGSFRISARPEEDCRLSVSHEGFARFEQRLISISRDLLIRLQVATLQQQVDVVAARPDPDAWGFGSVSLNADTHDLRTFAGTTPDLIRYMQLMAGTAARPVAVYVDGLPASGLPPLDSVAQISLNGDPFSAEYAHGDVAAIEIVTKAPDRSLRFFMGGDVPGIAGRDVLMPALRTASRFANIGMMGPVPGIPVTFSASVGLGRTSQEMPIRVGLSELEARPHAATSANGIGSHAVTIHYAPSTSTRARISFRQSHATGSNIGVGGITLQEAGFGSSNTTRDSRATATKTSSRFLFESGAQIGYADSTTRANATTPGIAIGGDVVMGGASITDSRRTTSQWMLRQVVRSRSLQPWTVGMVIAGRSEVNEQTPNSAGMFYFADAAAYRSALSGARSGIWYVTRGKHAVEYNNVTAATFAQFDILHMRQVALSGGLRADFQSGFRALVSPRVSFASQWRSVRVRAGAGMFVHRVPESLFLRVLENDGRIQQQLIATDVSLTEPGDAQVLSAARVQSRIASELTRPRAMLWRVSVERPMRNFVPALEYSFEDERRRPGSDRRLTDAGWLDVVESNRRAARKRVHAYARYSWKGQQFVIDHELTRALDNADGAFSFPEQPGNLAAEWARSDGVAPHTLSITGTLALPAGISLNVIDERRSSAPFNVTTAGDTDGNGLTLDRGGRPRNSGNGPRFHSLSLYAHRRLEWPAMFRMRRGSGIHVSLQADNILNNRNYFAVGSIAGSTLFGHPLAAYPGRSLRIMLSVD